MHYICIYRSLRHHNQYEPTIFKLDSGHIQDSCSYLQILKLNTTWNVFCYIQKKKLYNSEQCLLVLNNYIYTKWNHLWCSSFYHPFQKIFFYHLFYFLPGFAGKRFVVFQLCVLAREGVWVEDGAPWVSGTAAGDLAVEDLAEHTEEGQELCEAAHCAHGEQQVPRLPAQCSPRRVLLWIFLCPFPKKFCESYYVRFKFSLMYALPSDFQTWIIWGFWNKGPSVHLKLRKIFRG